jgi:hypothetical protein
MFCSAMATGEAKRQQQLSRVFDFGPQLAVAIQG